MCYSKERKNRNSNSHWNSERCIQKPKAGIMKKKLYLRNKEKSAEPLYNIRLMNQWMPNNFITYEGELETMV